MPTVLDQFIIEIGLDPKKLTAGQKLAVSNARQTAEDIRKIGEGIEKTGKSGAEYLGMLNGKLLALGGILTGGLTLAGVAGLAAKMTASDAATGRLAYTLGTNVKALDVWRNAAYLTGGSAASITGDIQTLTNQFQDFAITGESSVIPWFRALNVQISDEKTGKMRDFAAIMKDLANQFQKMDPVKAAAFGRNMGFSQDTINLLVKGGDELERILKLAQLQSTMNEAATENARKLQESYRGLENAVTGYARALLNALTPALIKTNEYLTKVYADRDKYVDKRSIFGRALDKMGLRKTDESNKIKTPGSAFSDKAEKEAFIRAEAVKRGISPDVAMAVARSEGFNVYEGDEKSSFGSFQLHYGGVSRTHSASGLGDTFTKKTGLDARDPSTERDQIKFALDEAAKGGWGPWHGWKGGQWAGISAGAGTALAGEAGGANKTGGPVNNDVKIGTINIQTQATDANGIASTIGPAIQRNGLANQAQRGPE